MLLFGSVNPACLTTLLNKALLLDPHYCIVMLQHYRITSQTRIQRLFEHFRPIMDPIDQLLHLQQEDLSIVDYVHQFCELSYQVPFDEIVLKDLF